MWRQMQIEWSGNRIVRKLPIQSFRAKEKQNELIFEISQRQRLTKFGKQHGFGRVYDIESYRKNVSIQSRKKITSHFNRETYANENPFSVEDIVGYIQNGRDQAEAMLVTNGLIKTFERTMNAWLHSAIHQFPGIANGDWVHLFDREVKPVVLPVCSRELVQEIFFATKVAQTFEASLETLVGNENIRVISAQTIDELNALSELVQQHQDQIVNRLLGDVKTTDRTRFSKIIPNRKRGLKLQKTMLSKGFVTLKDIWPSLDLLALPIGSEDGERIIYVHLHLADQIPVKNFIPNPFSFWWGYSPGLYNDEVALVSEKTLFEFIPAYESELEAESQHPVLIHQLVVGQRYVVAVTNQHGLYRQDTGQCVEFVGYQNDIPMVRYVGSQIGYEGAKYISVSKSSYQEINKIVDLTAA